MIVPVLFFLTCATITESLFDGDPCTLTNGKLGTCAVLDKCRSVFDELLAGTTPDTICGYDAKRVDPIICCPTKPVTTTTPLSVTPPHAQTDGRGAIARRKCVEYSQFVYVLLELPTLSSNHQRVNVSRCAITTSKPIVSSPKAVLGEFPHMAAVGFDLETGGIGWYCGGTLISESFVLTAAHCTYSGVWGNATWVRLGDSNLVRSDDGATPVDHRIVERIRHPEYKPPSVYHDIALLRLETRVSFNVRIRPACLHTEPTTGTSKAIATGWGGVDLTGDGGSNDLMKILLGIIDWKTCNTSLDSGGVNMKLPNGVVDDWIICAGAKDTSLCQGDSGGPLAIYNKKEFCMYDVVGVTSRGKVCEDSGLPGIYTRVYNYISWIESIVWGQG